MKKMGLETNPDRAFISTKNKRSIAKWNLLDKRFHLRMCQIIE